MTGVQTCALPISLAIDRADEAVAHLYDPWHPAVLRLLSQTITQSRAAGKSVCICGEMAGDPAFTELLLGMGLRSFSMHPSQIASIKQTVLRTEARRWAAHVEEVLGADEPELRRAMLAMDLPVTQKPAFDLLA